MPIDPPPSQVEVARAACEVARELTGSDLVSGRVDLVGGNDGLPLLMELELIEPSLYLHIVPGGTTTFVHVLVATLDT